MAATAPWLLKPVFSDPEPTDQSDHAAWELYYTRLVKWNAAAIHRPYSFDKLHTKVRLFDNPWIRSTDAFDRLEAAIGGISLFCSNQEPYRRIDLATFDEGIIQSPWRLYCRVADEGHVELCRLLAKSFYEFWGATDDCSGMAKVLIRQALRVVGDDFEIRPLPSK